MSVQPYRDLNVILRKITLNLMKEQCYGRTTLRQVSGHPLNSTVVNFNVSKTV
jgi:hypothetical protein